MRPSIGLAILVLAAALGTFLRVHGAFRTGLFDGSPEGLLRADPGVLWYLLQQVLAGPGPGFAADVRVEHPATVDLWATFTIGHEFLLAGAHALLPGIPLHRLCVIVLAICMSLCAAGVHALTRELTGKVWPAALAALLFACTPAAYRTVGFVLMNEDASLPLFAGHLALAARTLRVQSPAAAAAAALLAVAAAATWHATTFLLAIEMACAWIYCVGTGRALIARRAALTFLLTASLASLAVPALRAKAFAVGLPLQFAAATALAVVVGRRFALWPRAGRMAASCMLAAACAGAGAGASAWVGASGDFGHVFELVLAKLRHLGRFPDDPAQLSFDARIMWQGPFATLDPWRLATLLGLALLPAMAAIHTAVLAWRGPASRVAAGKGAASTGGPPAHPALPILAPFVLAALLSAWLIERMQVLPALLVPVAAAVAVRDLRGRRAAGVVAAILALQAASLGQYFATLELDWHRRVPREEARAAVAAVRALTEPGAAVACDPVLGGAILAHTGRRIAVPAKWESAASRARMRTLLVPFHRGTVADMHRAVRDVLQCRYFLVDRATLWGNCKHMSGFGPDALPLPGTAAAAFCSDDLDELTRIPGFRLLYRSPGAIAYDDGTPAENVRLFEVLP